MYIEISMLIYLRRVLMGLKKLDFKPFYGFLLTFIVSINFVLAQHSVKGKIVNATTGAPVSYVSVHVEGQKSGTKSDTSGMFSIVPLSDKGTLNFSIVGYHPQNIAFNTDILSFLTIRLIPQDNFLDEIVISRKNKKFKDPAIQLIENVIAHKKENNVKSAPFLQFNEYEKMQLGLVDPATKLKSFPGKFNFLLSNPDTAMFPGLKVVPFYLEENYAQIYTKTQPDKYKKIIVSHQQTKLDDRFINNDNWQTRFQSVLRDVDIYENTVQIINKSLLSPIASSATAFYQYSLRDTVIEHNEKLVQVSFQGKSKADLLFSGMLWITDDGRYAVKRVHLSIGKEANINFLHSLDIDLDFKQNTDQVMAPESGIVKMVFGSSKEGLVYGRKDVVYLNYLHNDIADHYFEGVPVEKKYLEKNAAPISIADIRPKSLSKSESQAYQKVDSLMNMKSFRTLMAVGYFVGKGYYSFDKFELGPLEYLYSRNDYEGNRIRMSIRSTRVFSEKVYLEGYAAYGFRDQRIKYYGSAAFTLNGERIVQFPAHYLRATVQHDVFEPGRNFGLLKGDSFFRSFRKNTPNKFQLSNLYRLDHMVEFGNHFSLNSGLTVTQREAVGNLHYVRNNLFPDTVRHINTSEVELTLRWAPQEDFTYRNMDRKTVRNKYPVFYLKYNKGIKGLLGGQYNYDAVHFSAFKRLFLSPAGRTDMELSAGRIFGSRIPYPLMEAPDIDKDLGGLFETFSLMNNLEFLSDKYLKFTYYHNWEGFFLNKIPFIQNFKLRELTGFRAFAGGISRVNNPYITSGNIQFDRNSTGYVTTRIMGRVPYMEGIVGLDNVFKILKVEYIRRLNYTTGEDISKQSVRVSLHLNF